MMRMCKEGGLPWPQLMEIAFGLLGIEPDVFWGMTPPEWLIAFKGWKRKYGIAEDEDRPVITHADLDEVMERFS